MSCKREGHVGGEDSGNDPKYRCVYCGSWGYESRWCDEDKYHYEECDCDLPYREHLDICE